MPCRKDILSVYSIVRYECLYECLTDVCSSVVATYHAGYEVKQLMIFIVSDLTINNKSIINTFTCTFIVFDKSFINNSQFCQSHPLNSNRF